MIKQFKNISTRFVPMILFVLMLGINMFDTKLYDGGFGDTFTADDGSVGTEGETEK